jgi:H+-transporting ATPase
MLVATGQATVYLVRERHHLWASRPSTWMLGATVGDLVAVTVLATRGILMAAVPLVDVVVVLAAVLVATLALDFLKRPLVASVRADTAPSRGAAAKRAP